MTIPINLASQPFRRDRAMLVASIAVSAALIFTLGALVSLILSDRAQMADVRRDISRLNGQIRAKSAERTRLETILVRPENAEVLERSVFINTLLHRKGVSWTRLLSDLEKVLPHNVRISNIRPTFDSQNQILLDLQVATEDPTAQIKLYQALENSPVFGAVLENQWTPPSTSEPLHRYRLTVNYAQKL